MSLAQRASVADKVVALQHFGHRGHNDRLQPSWRTPSYVARQQSGWILASSFVITHPLHDRRGLGWLRVTKSYGDRSNRFGDSGALPFADAALAHLPNVVIRSFKLGFVLRCQSGGAHDRVAIGLMALGHAGFIGPNDGQLAAGDITGELAYLHLTPAASGLILE